MASVLGMLKATIAVPQPVVYPPGLSSSSSAYLRRLGGDGAGGGGVAAPAGLVVECSSRPQKKGTAHHMKTRPKKTQPWDIRRGPTAYPPLPALPPDWTLVASGSASEEPPSQEAEVEEVVAVATA